MTERDDAIIIGAGFIGACTASELARRGWRTLNVDELPAAGYGSTGTSCAIIRTHYSTLDDSALAYEGFFCWDEWASYLGISDERGLAKFHKTGCLVMKTAVNGYLRSVSTNQGARHAAACGDRRSDARGHRPAPLRGRISRAVRPRLMRS